MPSIGISRVHLEQLSAPMLALIVVVALIAGISLSIWPLATCGGFACVVFLVSLGRTQRPLPLAFLAFLVIQEPLVFFAGGETTSSGLLVKRADELLLFVYSGYVLIFNRHVRELFRHRTLMLAVGCCYLGMAASTLINPVGTVPIVIDFALFSKPFLLIAIGASLNLSEEDISGSRRPLLLASMAIVLFAVVFMIFPQFQDAYIGNFRAADERVGIISAQGFFDGPGPYSWFCVATFSFAYSAYLVLEQRPYLIASIVSAAFAVLSWRRKSIAGLLVILLVAVLLRDYGTHRRTRALLALGLLLAGGALFLAPYVDEMLDYTAREYGVSDPFSTARGALHYTALLIARDHFPLGTGFATFGSHASRIYYSEVYVEYGLSSIWGLSPEFSGFVTDTFWPMVLGQGGVITLAAYVALLSLLVRFAWRMARSSNIGSDARCFAMFVLFVLLSSILESTSSHIYDATMHSALVMIPVGVLLTLKPGRARGVGLPAQARATGSESPLPER